MRIVSLLLCGAVAACAAQPKSIPEPTKPASPAQGRYLEAPAAAATDTDVANFFVACASAHTDAAIGSAGLTGKDDETQKQVAAYYVKVAEAYSSKDHTDTRWRELRTAIAAEIKQAMDAVGVFAAMSTVLRDAQTQMVACSAYVQSNKLAVEARLEKSGVLK